MRWFGRKAAGRGWTRPPLARGWIGESPGAWPQGYEAQVRESYLSNPIAQRAVRLVAEGVAATPIRVQGPICAQGDAYSEIVGPLLKTRSAGQELIETMALYLVLHGNAFVQLLTNDEGGLEELYALRPDRVTVEADGRGWPTGYAYRVADRVTRLPAEDAAGRPAILHIRTAHPLDDHYGLGCLGAASGAVAIHNAATRWNKALLDNAARPSGAMVYDPGEPGATLTTEQFDRLRDELQASFSGAANAGRPMLLEGGLKWQSMSLTPADMDFIGLKAAAARDIALAFGVPPMLIGLPGDAAYANYREANRSLWRQTILPLAQVILSGLAHGLASWFPGLSLEIESDRVAALAEDRQPLWAQVNEADFLSRSEKRAIMGLIPEAEPLATIRVPEEAMP